MESKSDFVICRYKFIKIISATCFGFLKVTTPMDFTDMGYLVNCRIFAG